MKRTDKIIYFLLGTTIGIFLTVLLISSVFVGYQIFIQNKDIKNITKDIVDIAQNTITPSNTETIPEAISDYKVCLIDSLERVFQDQKIKFNISKDINIYAASNEYENFQIIFYDVNKNSININIQIQDLISEEGAVISKDNITVRTEKYVMTKKPYYKTSYVGLWPDPLILEDSIKLTKGQVQPAWISVYVPPQTKAGNYKGWIGVYDNTNSKPHYLNINLRVWDFELPKAGHLKTAFDLYEHVFSKWITRKQNESHEEWQKRLKSIIEKYYEDMLKHRLSPIFNFDVSKPDFSERIHKYIKLGLNNFGIGPYNGSKGNNWPKDEQKLKYLIPTYRHYAKILRQHNLLDMAYLYTIDEGEIGNPHVPKVCSMVHKASPKLKNMVCYHGFWNPEKNPSWGQDIDIWTFQIEEFNLKEMYRLKKEGVEIWTYPSGPGDPSFPNFALDYPSLAYRIIPWMCWKYEIKGLLYWCVNWWTVDPFKSAANTKWEQNGNGLLYYPNEYEPIPSLRVKIIRDGLEDYEYFYILKKKRQELLNKVTNSDPMPLLKKSGKLLNIDKSIVKSVNKYTRDKHDILEWRKSIAETIEEINIFIKDVK